jgi:hypothetical protein
MVSLNELCYLNNCNNALFFEARRQHNDLYLWAAKSPNGPSIRFHVLNLHTMDEMKMTGNCLKGSRPIVVFDKQFDEEPHLKVIKETLTHVRPPFLFLVFIRTLLTFSSLFRSSPFPKPLAEQSPSSTTSSTSPSLTARSGSATTKSVSLHPSFPSVPHLFLPHRFSTPPPPTPLPKLPPPLPPPSPTRKRRRSLRRLALLTSPSPKSALGSSSTR